jgi:hypothetical protein
MAENNDDHENQTDKEYQAIKECTIACKGTGRILEVLHTAMTELKTDTSISIEKALQIAMREWDI